MQLSSTPLPKAGPTVAMAGVVPLGPSAWLDMPRIGNGPLVTFRGAADRDGDGDVDPGRVQRSYHAGPFGLRFTGHREATVAAEAIARATMIPTAVLDLTTHEEFAEGDHGVPGMGIGPDVVDHDLAGWWVVQLDNGDREPMDPYVGTSSSHDADLGGWSNPQLQREHDNVVEVHAGRHHVTFGAERGYEGGRMGHERFRGLELDADPDAVLPHELEAKPLVTIDAASEFDHTKRHRTRWFASGLNSVPLGSNAWDALTGFRSIAGLDGAYALVQADDGAYWAASLGSTPDDRAPIFDARVEPGAIVRVHDDRVKAVVGWNGVADIDGSLGWFDQPPG